MRREDLWIIFLFRGGFGFCPLNSALLISTHNWKPENCRTGLAKDKGNTYSFSSSNLWNRTARCHNLSTFKCYWFKGRPTSVSSKYKISDDGSLVALRVSMLKVILNCFTGPCSVPHNGVSSFPLPSAFNCIASPNSHYQRMTLNIEGGKPRWFQQSATYINC
jgi:hypothetical protein